MGKKKISLEELALGVRAQKALRRLGINTLDKFLEFDPEKVLELEGCGQTVYERIAVAQKRLRQQLKGKGKQRLDPKATFEALKAGLGSWAQRCLEYLGVKDLASLAAVKFVDFISLNGFGQNTWAEIDAARNQAIQALGGIVLGKQKEVYKNAAALLARPPTVDTLHATPLFSGLDPEFFKPANYHPKWRSDWPVSDMSLTVRAAAVAARHKAKTLGDLLLLKGPALLEERNAHLGTLQNIYDQVELIVLDRIKKLQRKVDYKSFQNMLRSWIKLTLSETLAPITLARFTTKGNRFPTYEELSKRYNVTRARVGQIWEKGRKELTKRQNLLVLDKFWDAVKRLSKQGTMDVEELAQKLKKAFKWKEAPPILALTELLRLHPDFTLAKAGTAVKAD